MKISSLVLGILYTASINFVQAEQTVTQQRAPLPQSYTANAHGNFFTSATVENIPLQPTQPGSSLQVALSQGSGVLVKGCNNQMTLSSDPLVINTAQYTECMQGLPLENPAYDIPTVLSRLGHQLRTASTRFEATMDQYNAFDKETIAVILDYLANLKPGQPPRLETYYQSIDPDMIRFMFSLCVQSYYDNRFANNPNNQSIEYRKMITRQEGEINKYKQLLVSIEDFHLFIKRLFDSETIVRLQEKRTETLSSKQENRQGNNLTDGRYGSNFGFDNENASGGVKFDQRQGGELFSKGLSRETGQEMGAGMQRSVEDVQIRSLAPNIVREIAIQYNALFGGKKFQTEDLTLRDIYDRLESLEGEVRGKLLEAEESRRILADPRVGEFWAKLRLIFDRKADGFMPIDVLYRNLSAYESSPSFTRGFAASKAQQKTKIDGGKREFSGIIMYKPKDLGPLSEVDEMIMAFSGSNSEEDWKHNFHAGLREGVASVNLAAGIRVHEGIMRSLEESLKEAGVKLQGWFDRYARQYEPGKPIPTLRIYLTGHSLGGALAMLMAVHIKQNAERYLKGRANIELKVYTFGAPPIFEKESAKVVEQLIGKNNIVRVWNIGDPVANLSIVKKTEEVFKNSLLMLLLQYRHVGLSIPLYDETQIGGFFDKFNPWKSHSSDRYNNLIVTNWEKLAESRTRQLTGAILSHGLAKDKLLSERLEEVIQFLRRPSPSAVLPLNGITNVEFMQMLQESNAPKKIEPRIANYQDYLRERYGQGERKAPKLARADRDSVTYTHNLPKTEVEVSIRRNTSCDVNNLVNPQMKTLLSANDQAELSCGCCLSKNFFVSDDASTTAKIRGVFGKKIGTIQSVLNHCDKYCKPIKSDLFPVGKDDVTAIGSFLTSLGLGDMWRQKGLR